MTAKNNITTDVAFKSALKEELGITNLEENQTTGVIVFETKALLDAYTPADTSEERASYKVTNDSDYLNNGYYHWVVDTFVKDDLISDGSVFTNGGSISLTGGIITPEPGYSYTDKLNIESIRGASYKAATAPTRLTIAFFDRYDKFISGISSDDDSEKILTDAEIPETAIYAYVSSLTSIKPYIALTVADAVKFNRPTELEVKQYLFSNSEGSYDEIVGNMYQVDSGGDDVTNPSDIGALGNVTIFPLGDLVGKKTYIKFKFKINEDINISRPDLDFTGNDADMLNIFQLYQSLYNERIGILPKPFVKQTYNAKDYVAMAGQSQFGSVWSVRNIQTFMTNDGFENKLFCGERAFSLRYIGADYASRADAIFLSNDGTTLRIYDSLDTTLFSWVLSGYSTMSDLYNAMGSETDLELKAFEVLDRVPSELSTFSDIPIVVTRDASASNECVYVHYSINEYWHTFEWMYDPNSYSRPIMQIDGNGIYVDFYNGDIFTRDITIAIGGTISGSNANISYKDIDIRIGNTLDAEMSINSVDGYTIISNDSPRVLVYTMHDVQDDLDVNLDIGTYLYSTAIDKMYNVFKIAKQKGYNPVTINDVIGFVKYGKTLPKRSILFINDDFRLYVFLNRRFISAFAKFNYPLTLALQNNYTTFDYDGVTYNVSDIVDRMRSSNYDIIMHTDHSPTPDNYDDFLSWVDNIENSYDLGIDASILVWVGGVTNPMACEESISEGIRGALTTTKGKVKQCTYQMRIPRYYIDKVESISQIRNEII
nr:hypothetical protein [uncultured Draconibacterium sp.]